MPRGDDSELGDKGIGAIPPSPVHKTKRAAALYSLLASADPTLVERLSSKKKPINMANAAIYQWLPDLTRVTSLHDTRMELTVALSLDAEQKASHLCHYRDWRSSTSWWTTPLAKPLAGWYGLSDGEKGINPDKLKEHIREAAKRPPFRSALIASPLKTLAQAVGGEDSVDIVAGDIAKEVDSEALGFSESELRDTLANGGFSLPGEDRNGQVIDRSISEAWIDHPRADAVANNILERAEIDDDASGLRKYFESLQSIPTSQLTPEKRATIQRVKSALGLVLNKDPRKL